MFLLLTFSWPKPIGVFLLLAFLLTLNRYFCFSLKKSNNFYRNRLSYASRLSLFKERSFVLLIILTTRYYIAFSIYLSFPVTHCAGHNTELPSKSNMLKTVRINIAFPITFKRVFDKLSNDIKVDRLCTCDSLVIDV